MPIISHHQPAETNAGHCTLKYKSLRLYWHRTTVLIFSNCYLMYLQSLMLNEHFGAKTSNEAAPWSLLHVCTAWLWLCMGRMVPACLYHRQREDESAPYILLLDNFFHAAVSACSESLKHGAGEDLPEMQRRPLNTHVRFTDHLGKYEKGWAEDREAPCSYVGPTYQKWSLPQHCRERPCCSEPGVQSRHCSRNMKPSFPSSGSIPALLLHAKGE